MAVLPSGFSVLTGLIKKVGGGKVVAALDAEVSTSGTGMRSTDVQGALTELDGLATAATLRAVAPVNGKKARTRTCAAAGDDGGGTFLGVTGADPGTYTHDGGVVLVPTGGNGSAAWIREDAWPIRPQYWGGRPGSGDPTAATQAAIDYVQAAGGGVVYFSAGTWTFPSTTPLDPGSLSIAFVGDGKESTTFEVAEGTIGDELYCFRNTTTTRKGNLRFEGIRFLGTLESDERNNFGNPLYLDYYSDVRIVNCAFDWIAGPAMDFHSCLSFRAINCDFRNLGRDGIRVRDTPDCIATGCFFRRLGDDPVAFHTADYEVEADVPAGIPIRERMIVSACDFVSTGPVKMLGAKKAVVSDCTGHLIRTWAVNIETQDSSEGTNPLHDILIQNNIWTNVYQGGQYIKIETLAPRGGDDTNDVAPMRYDSVSGTIIKPWDWYQSVADDDDYPFPPAAGIRIQGNVCRRTVPAAAAWSDYGVGTLLNLGVSSDPAVADSDLRLGAAVQIAGDGSVCGLDIQGNVFEHAINGLQLTAPDTEMGIKNATLRNNTFFDIRDYGVILFPNNDRHVDLTIQGNLFDIDYYRVNSNSNLNGTYDSNGLPVGVATGAARGITIRGNRFANTCRLVAGSNHAYCVFEDNEVVTGQPASIAFSTSNKGIGAMFPGQSWRYIIADCDPTSGTYGAISHALLRESASIPTSGWYPIGWVVWSTAPTSSLRGWSRITTGTGHVLDTDWVEF